MISTVALSSAAGAPRYPINRFPSSPFSSVDIRFHSSTLTMMMMSKRSFSSSAIPARINLGTTTIRPTLTLHLARTCYSTMVAFNNSTTSVENDSSATISEAEGEATSKIGARVRVKVSLKVYHVPRVPEVDLTGMEGHLKQHVALWKGKRISANLPYKMEFVVDIENRGPVKFFAHLKEDEFEYLD